MDNNDKSNKKYLQCLSCGHIYEVSEYFKKEMSVVTYKCPKCGYMRGLLCDKDLYKYYDPVLDERFYEYN